MVTQDTIDMATLTAMWEELLGTGPDRKVLLAGRPGFTAQTAAWSYLEAEALIVEEYRRRGLVQKVNARYFFRAKFHCSLMQSPHPKIPRSQDSTLLSRFPFGQCNKLRILLVCMQLFHFLHSTFYWVFFTAAKREC